MKQFLYCIFFVLVSISQCYATPSAEVPGDGADDSLLTGGAASGTIGSCPLGSMDAVYGIDIVTPPAGCDRKCPIPDEDCDGFNAPDPITHLCTVGKYGSSACDADDHDRRNIPLDYYACDAGGGPVSGYHQALTNGTYSSCISNSVTPLCEATGGGVCKYIDCGAAPGGTGTYLSPYNTAASAASVPTGSFVYFKTGVCTTQVTPVNSGTTWESYPGGSSSFNLVNAGAFEINVPNTTLIAISFTGVCNSAGGNMTPVHGASNGTTTANNFEARRCVFEHTTMSSFNNNSDIYLNSTNGSNVHHNFFYDWSQGTGGCNNPGSGQNVHGMHWLDDPPNGADHVAQFNVYIQPLPYDATQSGSDVRFKHGVALINTGVNGVQVRNSIFVSPPGSGTQPSIDYNGSGLRFHHNLLVSKGISIGQSGGTEPNQDNQVFNNTVLNRLIGWVPNYQTITDKLTVHDNVVYDSSLSYSSGNHEGIVDIDGYGSSSEEAQLRANNGGTGSLFFYNNCYFNPNIAPNFSYFSEPAGGGGHGPADAVGGNYNFSQWQINTGPVAIPNPPGNGPQQTDLVGSFVTDPILNTFNQPTAPNCVNKGADPVATPTPVPGGAVAAITHSKGFRIGR